MSISEQELYGLMAIANEQQQAAAIALEKLEAQRKELDATIASAKTAVLEMEKAGRASAIIIEKATRIAVTEAVSASLEAIRDQTASALADSVKPSVKALEGATKHAKQAGHELGEAAGSISWKWTGIWAFTGAVLLLTVVGLSMLLVPSPMEIADLRANVADLEARGGRVQLTTCGDSRRLCARIDPKAEKGDQYGQNGQRWMILQGY